MCVKQKKYYGNHSIRENDNSIIKQKLCMLNLKEHFTQKWSSRYLEERL